MSSYIRNTRNPKTGKFEAAFWLDDYYKHHHYGVEFADGNVYDPRQKPDSDWLETNDEPSTGEVSWPKRESVEKVEPTVTAPNTPLAAGGGEEELQELEKTIEPSLDKLLDEIATITFLVQDSQLDPVPATVRLVKAITARDAKRERAAKKEAFGIGMYTGAMPKEIGKPIAEDYLAALEQEGKNV